MTARLAKNPAIPRSEQVRRRRQQKTKRRYDAVSRVGGTTLRSGPLVSRPRTGPAVARLARAGRGGLLAALLPAGVSLSLPALPRVRLSWRIMSITLVALLGALLGRMLIDPGMYISGVNLGGAALVPGQEVYAASGIAGQHIFWVDAAAAQRKVAAVPGIASAVVRIDWPATVTIQVIERVPVVSWTEGSQKSWVDADGNKFAART